MSMEQSISLEETNKIRISLGLKPLTDNKATTSENKEKQAEDNYSKQREQEAKDRETKGVQDRIAKVRNKRELNAKLKGATLGDVDADVDDTLKWIKRSKKKEKELVRKRQEELENMDKVFQGDEYTEKDLEGLKVSHDFDGMEDGEARVLTLKDSRILDNEEDELQNIDMAEREREKKNQELKIKRRDYTGYDDEEFGPGTAGMKRAVLSKYDDFLEGPKEMGFRLGSSTIGSHKNTEESSTVMSVNKSLLTIDYAKNIESADYLQPGDVGFKKPKTKKKRSSRRVNAEESDIPPVDGEDRMQVDEKPVVPRSRNLDANFVDDDELQAALARSRRAKLHKPKKLSPEEIAKQIAEQRIQSEAKDAIMVDDDAEEEGGLTIDDTSEFVRAITYDPTAVKKEPFEPSVKRDVSADPSRQPAVPPPRMKPEDEDVDQSMEEIEAGEVVVKEEEDEEAMLNAIENAIKEMEATQNPSGGADAAIGTALEQTFGSGMAATLTILRQQGVLAHPSADQAEREQVQRQRDFWLADYRRMVSQRESDRAKTRGGNGNKDQATREYENRLREQQEARQNLDAFKSYKPDVNIVYYDEFGRELTPKEAWKALSHKFHGKGSGKMKTEKRLKKIAEERKTEAMASGDTPLNMNQAFQIRQEKTGQAHFVLSVGNRGAVPQAEEFLDTQPLSKGKTEKKNKKKQSGKVAAPHLDSTGFMTLPAPILNGDSPVPGTSANGSPAPRPGFSRIWSVAEVDSSKEATPVPSDRTKVVIGLGAKRKATGEAQGTPPPKRR